DRAPEVQVMCVQEGDYFPLERGSVGTEVRVAPAAVDGVKKRGELVGRGHFRHVKRYSPTASGFAGHGKLERLVRVGVGYRGNQMSADSTDRLRPPLAPGQRLAPGCRSRCCLPGCPGSRLRPWRYGNCRRS